MKSFLKSVFSRHTGMDAPLEVELFEAIIHSDLARFRDVMDQNPDLGAVLRVSGDNAFGDFSVSVVHAVIMHRDLVKNPEIQASFLEILVQKGADFVSEQGAGMESCTPAECAKFMSLPRKTREMINCHAGACGKNKPRISNDLRF